MKDSYKTANVWNEKNKNVYEKWKKVRKKSKKKIKP